MVMTAPELKRLLEELVAALDRRLPGAGRIGEAAIAQDAAALRAKAVALLAELEGSAALAISAAGPDEQA
jgi:hypothetical protein